MILFFRIKCIYANISAMQPLLLINWSNGIFLIYRLKLPLPGYLSVLLASIFMTLLTFYSFIYDLFLSQARIRGYSPEKEKEKKRIEEQPLFWNSTDNDLFRNISIKSGEEMRRGFDTWNPMLLPHDLTHNVGVARATWSVMQCPRQWPWTH